MRLSNTYNMRCSVCNKVHKVEGTEALFIRFEEPYSGDKESFKVCHPCAIKAFSRVSLIDKIKKLVVNILKY